MKYLAWRSERPLVYRRVSDLVSCYVGQTERNIAAAFEEARQDGSILLFDEADSFLRDRRGAVRSWEVTQVNEFLQQLESFPGIVACTTNLWRDIDEAALRRFVFKLELLFPTADQWRGSSAPSSPRPSRPLGRRRCSRPCGSCPTSRQVTSRRSPGAFARSGVRATSASSSACSRPRSA